jgi:hypothetical protein
MILLEIGAAKSGFWHKKLFLVPQEGRAPLKIFTLNWEECQLQSDLGFVSNDEIVEAP